NVASNQTIRKYLHILNEINLIDYDGGKVKTNLKKSSIALKPKIHSEGEDCANMSGVYFIYDKDDNISYIGKSVTCVVKRSLESMTERCLYDFTRIEIKPTKNQSDVEIYEKYYIQKYKPYCNK